MDNQDGVQTVYTWMFDVRTGGATLIKKTVIVDATLSMRAIAAPTEAAENNKKERRHVDFSTRYGDMGAAMPDPETMCHGECEGTGWVPVTADGDERYAEAWAEAEAITPTDDGWHFVKCLDCGGTGLAPVKEDDDGSHE